MKYLSFLLLGLVLACSDSSEGVFKAMPDESSGFAYTSADLEETSDLAIDMLEESLDEVVEVKQEQQIIKTANLRFESKNLDETHAKIMELTNSLKGFVGTDNSGKNYNEHYRNLSIRIPSENFQAFIDGVSEGVSYFDRKDISRRDVTEEFVDLEARLKAKRELENRYLELLSQARNVKEMLEIERELSTIREEIEAKQGRLNYLKDKVSLSTINIQFYKHTVETGVTVSYGQKMKKALAGGWDGISIFFLGLLYLWPLFVILGLLIWFIRRLIKRKKKKKKGNSNTSIDA